MRGEAKQGGAFTPHPSRLTPHEKPVIHVACGVLVNAAGEVLIAQRPVGKIAAGYWEFPGGKIEDGETAEVALVRELEEELGVRAQQLRPLIRFRHEYSNRSVVLDTWRVSAYAGEPASREGQAFAWRRPEQFASLAPLLPTVAPIASALQLPVHYVFTPPQADADFLLPRLAALPAGALLRLRCPALDEARYAQLAALLRPATRARGLLLVVDRSPQLALQIGADGWHATAERLRSGIGRPAGLRCFASCHDEVSLRLAHQQGFAAAVLGPVCETATHPGRAGLGWDGFEQRRAELPLPVYALGGLSAADLPQAFAHYAQGIAAIRAYWA